MKFIFGLSIKNLLRYKRRTIITCSALAFGVALFLWMDGFLLGAAKDSERNLIYYETGSAKIMNKQYFDEIQYLPLKYVVEDPAGVENILDEKGITHTRRTVFAGEVFFGEGDMPVKIIAINPETDSNVFKLEETLDKESDSRFLKTDEDGILIGHWLARDLKATIGDEVSVRTRTRYGTWEVLDLTIVGIINSPNPVINKGTGFIPISVADEMLEMDGAVSEIAMLIPDWENLNEKLSKLTPFIINKYPKLTIQSWADIAKDFVAINKAKTGNSKIIIFLILIIAAVGISNTMLMAVFERVKEMGMMRAMGMKDSDIRLSFLIEAGFIGIIGSVIGIILGGLLTWVMVEVGLDYSGLLGDMDIGYRTYGVFRAVWNPPAFIIAFIVSPIACMLISLLPSSRALKMDITAALRYE